MDAVGYIFDSMKRTEVRFNKQRKLNRKVAIFMVATIAHLIIVDMDRKDHAVRIRELEKELDTLKHEREDEKECDD
jgi:hypothetical protein